MTDTRHIPPMIATIERYFAAFTQGDIEQALTLLTDDAIWHVDGDAQVFSIGLMSGKQQIANWMRQFPQQLTPIAVNINHSFINQNQVVVLGYFRYLVNKTGHYVSSDMVMHFTFENEKIARYQIFEDSLLLARSFAYHEDTTRREIKLNGARYAYTDRGEGPVLIFMHGLFADHTLFAAQLAELAKDYRCIAFDLPGHGASDYHQQGWSLPELAQDIALFIRELRLGPVTLIGQSQGGMIAMLLAALQPALVTNLILIGTTARAEYQQRLASWQQTKAIIRNGTFAEKEQLFTQLQALVNTAQWREANPIAAAQARKRLHLCDAIGLSLAIDAATINRQDIRAYLCHIQARTLVICGDQDQATPIALNKELSDGITNSQLIILAGVAHHPPTEAPAEVLTHLRQFLQST